MQFFRKLQLQLMCVNEGPAGKTFGLSVIAELVQYFITASQIFPLIPFP